MPPPAVQRDAEVIAFAVAAGLDGTRAKSQAISLGNLFRQKTARDNGLGPGRRPPAKHQAGMTLQSNAGIVDM